MRGPREIKRWINRLRKRFSGKNGVVGGWAFDNPWMERKLAKSFKQRSRSGRNLADAHTKKEPTSP